MALSRVSGERNQAALMQLVSQPGNDICADCKGRNPRWASYSLGIFLCLHCASIHRKMGTHISKVKSLTLDTWTKEQVEFMRSEGNTKSNKHYNPDEVKYPPPTNMIDQERDSDLEKYIRDKYQFKSFVSRSAKVAALLGPSRSASSRLSPTPERAQTLLSSSAPSSQSQPSPSLTSPPTSSSIDSTSVPPASAVHAQPQSRSVSQPVAPLAVLSAAVSAHTPTEIQRPATQPLQSSNPVWNDLAQLEGHTRDASLPPQYPSPMTETPSISVPILSNTGLVARPHQFTGLSMNPNNPFPSTQGMDHGSGMRSVSLNTGLSLNTNPGAGGNMGVGLNSGMSHSMVPPFNPPTTPNPSPFIPQSVAPTGLGLQQQPQSFASSPFSQHLIHPLSFQPQQNPPQGPVMFMSQPMQMFQPQTQSAFLSTYQSQLSTSPAQHEYGQSMMFAQNAYSQGWQPTGNPGQQQQWGGM